MLLLKNLAKETGIGESTVRFYMSKFPEFVYYQRLGRRKLYSPEMVKVIRYIADHYAAGWSAVQISDGLGHEFQRVIDVEPEKKENLPVQKDETLEALLAKLDTLYGQISEVGIIKERLEQLERAQLENALLKEQVAAQENKLAEQERKIEWAVVQLAERKKRSGGGRSRG